MFNTRQPATSSYLRRVSPCRRPRRHYRLGLRAQSGGSHLVFARPLHSWRILLPPVVFTGLLVALWTWKCLMMIIFQNRIIFMPGMPPGTRREEIQDYSKQCAGIRWDEVHIRSDDGTKLVLAVAFPPCLPGAGMPEKHVYVLYMQGNAASTPPRLPTLSAVLQEIRNASREQTLVTMVAVGYRGFWKSQGRASERGINDDTVTAVRWVVDLHTKNHGATKGRPVVILWGQSIGAGFATNLAARLITSTGRENKAKVDSLILETPFISIRAMLEALYPQKWLPYRYLWPFLRTHLDSWANMEKIATRRSVKIQMVVAENDELVPRHQAETLRQRCENLGISVKYHIVPGAYHNEASYRSCGRRAIANFVLEQSNKN
ncbi:BEM46 family protein [Pyricularia oryzae]|nr:BEM46 family protein [Pyricularia oryzae]KAI7927212.1 BEM46 family protein [Pyricularia oryzae]